MKLKHKLKKLLYLYRELTSMTSSQNIDSKIENWRQKISKTPRPGIIIAENDALMQSFNISDSMAPPSKHLKFETLGLPQHVIEKIYSCGLEKPTSIQQIAIAKILDGRDCFIQSNSGTGKTYTFTIPVLCAICPDVNVPQAIVISNTQPLALQSATTAENIINSGDKSKNYIRVGRCIGNNSYQQTKNEGDRQFNQKSNCDNKGELSRSGVIYATVGKLYSYVCDFQILDVSRVGIVIIDEADRVLGDEENYAKIFGVLSRSRRDIQIVFVSATFTEPTIIKMINLIRELKNDCDPENIFRVFLNPDKITLDGIKQYYVQIEVDQSGRFDYKYDTLIDIFNSVKIEKCIIFVNKRETAVRIYRQMKNDNQPVGLMMSDLSREMKSEIFRDFTCGVHRFLIATNIIGRGIDIHSVNLVINYELPYTDKLGDSYSEYIHRIGRTGRYGNQGVAISLVDEKEKRRLEEMSHALKFKVEELPANIGDIISPST